MAKVILITDINLPLGLELAKLYIQNGYCVVGTITVKDEEINDFTDKPFLQIPWRRNSALSARHVVVSTLNSFSHLDKAIVIEDLQGAMSLLHETNLTDIESAVDMWIKGGLFIVREILSYFLKDKRGSIALVNYSPRRSEEAFSPLEGSIRGSFRGLANSLFTSYYGSDIFINAFESFSPLTGEFAHFIHKTLHEKGDRLFGKWFRFQGKHGRF